MTDKIHPFEKAGLGKAPFHYVGIVVQEMAYGERVIGSVGGCLITTQPGGTCDYCGHYILNMFQVESADGKRFKVGCDCIHKCDGKLDQVIQPDVKAAKLAREQARIDQAKTHVDDWELMSRPHPTAYMASQGKTLADYCRWMFKNAGHTGRLTAARLIERAIATPIVE